MVSVFIWLIATAAILIGLIVLFVTVFLPLCGSFFRFIGRTIRFFVHEIRDCLLIPVALFVCIIKVLRAGLCIVLARWDVAKIEIDAAKRRLREVRDRITAALIDNPLRIIAINPPKDKYPQHSQVHRRNTPVGASNKFYGYKIIGTLPPGGSGAKIYVAQPNKSSNTVVIKCFDISDGSALPQIVRESRSMEAAKKLGLIIEHHLDDERFWYAMPHHAGDHLGVITDSLHGKSSSLGPNQLRAVLGYQQNLLQTLREYHQMGLWHKDVKPNNIIVQDETAHLVDLGLVTSLSSAMTLTTHGTEYFRDPELVRQAMRGVKVHQVDGSKFDVYSAGAVLYFMLENTFPPHGGLSGFNKKSPEGIRWIVRRAMSDYDKRYSSVDEMLGDVETALRSNDISSVRPADLPSMLGVQAVIEDVPQQHKLPTGSTPSTGGGPFKTPRNNTKPMGIIALVAAILIGVTIVYSTTSHKQVDTLPRVANQESTHASLLAHPRPSGAILLLDECALASNPEGCKKTVTTIVEKLALNGWEIVSNEDLNAKARTWIPEDLQSSPEVAMKLEMDQLVGILVLKEGDDNTVVATIVERSSSNSYIFDNTIQQ